MRVLIVHDQPIVVKAMRTTLLELSKPECQLIIDVAMSYEGALKCLSKSNGCEVILLDTLLKSLDSDEGVFGENLVIEIVELYPEAKIIFFTDGRHNIYRVRRILKKINPLGFLIMTDIDCNQLKKAFKAVIRNQIFYSPTVQSIFKIDRINNFEISDIDREILHYISIGIKTKDLPNHLPLSISGVEKRKRRLRAYFDIEGKGDSGLINVAKKNKII